MKRKLVLTVLAGAMALSSAAPAFAVNEGPGKGNPDTTKGGHCPPGQNKDTSPGGLKKCG